MVRGTVIVASVCVTNPALAASMGLTVSVTITPVFVSGESSVEVTNHRRPIHFFFSFFAVELVS